MNWPLGMVNGVSEPELLTKLPPAATTMALPVPLTVMDAPLESVRLPPVVAVTDAAVMDGSVMELVEASVRLLSAVESPTVSPKLMVPAVALKL